MKKFIISILGIIVCSASIYAQKEIISVVPNAGYQEQDINIMIKAQNTNFKQGITTLAFEQGIVVNQVLVSSNLLLTANITINKNANYGAQNLQVTTGNEVVVLEDAFEILEEGAQVNAILSLIPVDVIYLSDFDPQNIQSSPVLFSVSVINDAKERDIRVEFILKSEEHGTIGIANKNIKGLKAFETQTFNNKEFDEYNVGDINQELITLATQTGMLPSGTYQYIINIYDENGILIGTEDVENDFSNEINNIDLISPGNPLDETPALLVNQYPYFQWFSNAFAFDFILYEVNPGQKSVEDIVTNVPVYEQKNISNSFFTYPNHAEVLKEGQTYAWQVKAYVNSSKGQQILYSDIMWFAFKDSDPENFQIVEIEVLPEPFSMQIGEKHQFKAYGYNENGDRTELECDWSVIPSNFGYIDFDGNFTAGNKPKTIAIVARYRGLQAYATVDIEWFKNAEEFEEWNMSRFIRNIFGTE